MSRSAGLSIVRLSARRDWVAGLARDVRDGLSATPRHIPTKYLYAATGSELFQQITELPEYYLTRAETEILELYAAEILAGVEPEEVLELGPGYSHKTELLLAAGARAGTLRRYRPLDISEEPILAGSARLRERFPWLEVSGLVGDYFTDLPQVRLEGRQLIVILGSTIGNYPEFRRRHILGDIAAMLAPGDGFLVGVDLVKDAATLVAAYDDAQGVTAAFSLNLLRVVNDHLDADFDISGFRHVAEWDEDRSCVAIHLESVRHQTVYLRRIDYTAEFAAGDVINTEVSCKFTREGFAAELDEVGLREAGWWSDGQRRFGLVLAEVLPPA